jgi:hypothetical protein
MLIELAIGATFTTCAPAFLSRAQSPTAMYVAQQTEENLRHLHSAIVFGANQAFEELRMIYDECQTENWDGYGALAIGEETYLYAENFLKVLPLGTRAPSVGAEPDGQLTLEWYQSPRHVLSLSISPDGMVHYAGLFDSSRAFGSEPFVGKVPEIVLNLIKRVFPA